MNEKELFDYLIANDKLEEFLDLKKPEKPIEVPEKKEVKKEVKKEEKNKKVDKVQ